MTIGAHDSSIFGELFSDPAINALFFDRNRIRALLRVEGALARVQGRLGLIPGEAAAQIESTCDHFDPEPASLAQSTRRSGVPVIGLLEQLRVELGDGAADYLHWGATSQDILDTALALQMREALAILETALAGVMQQLAALTRDHRRTLLVARTRWQQAVPTVFALKTAGWLAPLLRHQERLAQLRPRLLAVQCGGAGGNLGALGPLGMAVCSELAIELELTELAMPWHTQRDGIGECANWLSLVTGSLGKMGQDILLMAQSEVGELAVGAAGGSSAMPQKANPIAAETLVGAARFNAVQVSAIHQALIQEHERGGIGWQLEWLTLPQMLACTGGALRCADELLAGLTVDAGRMARTLDQGDGLVLAESLVFRLARHMGMTRARALVSAACKQVAQGNDLHLVDALRELTDAPVDWRAAREPGNAVGSAEAFIDRVLHHFDTHRTTAPA